MTRRTDPAPTLLPQVSPLSEAFPLAEGQKAFAVAARMQAEALKTALQWQVETLAFLSRRAGQTVQLIDDLAADEEFKDSFDIAAAYMQNAALDWTSEMGRLAALGQRIAADAAQTMHEHAAAVAEDMAASTIAA